MRVSKDGSSEEGHKARVFLFERNPDNDLWKVVRAQSKGTDDDRLKAMETVISQNRELPEEADQIAVTMSKTGSLHAKRRMASMLASKPSISWGLSLSLLENLGREDDIQIVETIAPLLEPYRRLTESLKEWQGRVFGSIPKELFSGIVDQQAALERALVPVTEAIQCSMQVFSQLNFPLEQLGKTFESLGRFEIPSVQIPRHVLDSINTFSRYDSLTYGNLARVSTSYYPPEEQKPYTAKASDDPLIVQLRRLPPGQETWPEYQKLCQAILSFCFVPPLLEPLYEASTESGIHRRDMIYHIPHEASGFWAHVRTAYFALAVIMDAKNYSDTLPKDQIVITSKYFGPKKLGNFGIIVCRAGLNDSGKKELADRWVHHDEMIVCLTDDDLEEMVGLKLAGQDAERVIDHKIRELRSAL